MEIDELHETPEDTTTSTDLNADTPPTTLEGHLEEDLHAAPDDTIDTTTTQQSSDNDTPPAATANDDEAGQVPADDLSNLTGIERYLSQFDVDGGIIKFEDGKESHFNDLSPEKQEEVLMQLHEAAVPKVEEKYGLDESEINLLNHLRNNKISVEEMIETAALQKAQEYINTQQVGALDFNTMEDDVAYQMFLKVNDPEITTEQLEKDLKAAKQLDNYQSMVKGIKSSLATKQTELINEASAKENQDLFNEIEAQRKEVVDAVKNIDKLDGFSLNNDMKNSVLDMVLSVDDSGDSKFMTEVFSDPAKLFRAAFWYKNGPDIVSTLENHWKKQKSDAFKRGQGGISTKQSFTKTTDANNQSNGRASLEPESLDDIY